MMLTTRERELLRKYAYPFEVLEKELEKCKGCRGEVEITTDALEWEQAVGQISISVNEVVRSDSLLEELDELACQIEYELERN